MIIKVDTSLLAYTSKEDHQVEMGNHGAMNACNADKWRRARDLRAYLGYRKRFLPSNSGYSNRSHNRAIDKTAGRLRSMNG